MRFPYLLYLARKRIAFKKVRSVIVVIPLLCMVALFVATANWTFNLQLKIQSEIVEPAKQQQTLLTVENSGSGQPSSFLDNKQLFKPITQQQLSSILALSGVKYTSAVRNVPYSSGIAIDGLAVNGATSVITSLDATLAQLFGVNAFNFTPGQPIPIILGQGAFTESYIDFNEKQTIEVPVRGDQETSADRQARPIKTKLHRELMNTAVVGLQGNLTLPLMPAQPDYTYNQIQRSGSYIDVYAHITPEQLATYNASTTAVWKKYWDVTALHDSLSIPVIVVGINKSNDRTNSYIPPAAVLYISQLVRDRYELARNDEIIPATILKHSSGILLPDNTLKIWPTGYLANSIPDLRTLGNAPSQLPVFSRYISGQDDTIVLQELKRLTFTNDTLVSSAYIVEADSQVDIRQIASKITGIGLVAYDDWSSGAYGEILGLAAPFIVIALAVAMVIAILCISILAWAYAIDSTKEIGILRSLGATGKHGKQYIVLQLALMAFVAVVMGTGVGLAINYILASSLLNVLDSQTAIARSLAVYNVTLTRSDISRLHLELILPIGIAAVLVPLAFGILAALASLHKNPIQAIITTNE